MQYIGTAVTDIGIVKKVNQDSLTWKLARSRWGEVGMAVLCDGLGGLAQGEVASGNVVLAFDRWFREDFMTAEQEWTQERIRAAWEEIVFSMNRKIKEYGRGQGVELGTTLTAVLFLQNQYYLIHVGDCRLYEVASTITQITRDHTLVAQELARGAITEEEARRDSRRNVLLQCIGVTDNLIPDFVSGEVRPDTSYLICSDGFRHVITEEELYQFCNPFENQTQTEMLHHLERLTELNKQRGERDNISAILVRVGSKEC